MNTQLMEETNIAKILVVEMLVRKEGKAIGTEVIAVTTIVAAAAIAEAQVAEIEIATTGILKRDFN